MEALIKLVFYLPFALVRCQLLGNGGNIPPYTIQFVGVGYNLLKGNPEGGETSQAGVDPGLLLTRKIFSLSPGYIPKEIVYEHHQTCASGTSTRIFYGGKTYQNYLLLDAQSSGVANNFTEAYAFTMSQGYQDVQTNTQLNHDVYRDVISTCNMGHARYLLPPSGTVNSVTPDFASNVCNLPVTYDEAAYIHFLDTWGTHVITDVEIGYRNVTRYRQSIANLAETMLAHNEDVGIMKEQPYLGYGTVLELNMTKFRHTDYANIQGGKLIKTFSYGSSQSPEPIAINMVTIAAALDESFWRNITSLKQGGVCTDTTIVNLEERKTNLIRALERYAIVKGAVEPTDPDIILPVTWPRGTYALMKPTTGCPQSPNAWLEGWRVQDSEDTSNSNSWTPGIHLAGSPTDKHRIRLEYCVKNDPGSSEYERDWPAGNYCIMKRGSCPAEFKAGSIHWDDEDGANANSAGGTLPDGTYNSNTDIYYCCRSDGGVQMEILLPIDKPFYLIRFTAGCQQVKNMDVREELLHFDTEDSFNKDSCSGSHPYDATNCRSNHELHFCYYTRQSASVLSPVFG